MSQVCPACLCDFDSMGVLNTNERVYLHEEGYCLHSLDDENGFLRSAVDQIKAHMEDLDDGM